MNHHSIRVRLTAWYAAVLLAGMALLGVLVFVAMERSLRFDLRHELAEHGGGIADYLIREDSENDLAGTEEVSEVVDALPDGYSVEIRAGDQMVYRGRRMPQPRDLTLEREVRGPHHRYLLRMAVTTRPMHHALSRLFWLLLLAIPVVTLAACAGGFWISGRALRPVDEMTRAAQEIGIHDLGRRLPVSGARDELQRLAEAWNDLLARLDSAVTRISRFTANASHELRTPLAVIRSTAELALRRPRSEGEYREALASVETETRAMTELIEDLLILARHDASKDAPALAAIDLREPVATACREYHPLAASRSVALLTELPESAVTVRGSGAGLARLFSTLLDNAIKYTPESGSVRVRLTQTEGTAQVTVEDTGIGIAAEDLPHIFERFYRADKARARETGGYGLGLSIAQAIAAQHGGEIRAASGTGGSEITVELPVL